MAGQAVISIREVGAHVATRSTKVGKNKWEEAHTQCFCPSVGPLRMFPMLGSRPVLKFNEQVLILIRDMAKAHN